MKRLAVALATMLGGCALLSPQARESTDVSRITSETVTASRAPVDTQRQALERAKRDYRREPSDANRLRLAAMLTTLPDPLRDEGHALALLKPLARQESRSPYCSFAVLLTSEIAERQRLAQENERLAREGQKREEALQKQLDAFKSIERGIIRREEAVRQPETTP
ncbi:MAG TPA: hypothetical protein VKP89_09535 [Burkholderiales bacterium]|nr:hypothetical protein [Burkholderiales bacterium]